MTKDTETMETQAWLCKAWYNRVHWVHEATVTAPNYEAAIMAYRKRYPHTSGGRCVTAWRDNATA